MAKSTRKIVRATPRGKAWELPPINDDVDLRMRAVARPRRCDEDTMRLLGRDLARAMNDGRLERAFGGTPFERWVVRCLVENDSLARLRFLRWHLADLVPYGVRLAEYVAGLFSFRPGRENSALREEEVRRHLARTEHGLKGILGQGPRHARSYWPGGVRVLQRLEEARSVALYARWTPFQRAAERVIPRALYRRHHNAWDSVKSLICAIVEQALQAYAEEVGTDSPQVATARYLQRDFEFIFYCTAGAIMAGLTGEEGRPNPFFEISCLFLGGGLPIGIAPEEQEEGDSEERFQVFLPPCTAT